MIERVVERVNVVGVAFDEFPAIGLANGVEIGIGSSPEFPPN